jgi:hypothetical protein
MELFEALGNYTTSRPIVPALDDRSEIIALAK